MCPAVKTNAFTIQIRARETLMNRKWLEWSLGPGRIELQDHTVRPDRSQVELSPDYFMQQFDSKRTVFPYK